MAAGLPIRTVSRFHHLPVASGWNLHLIDSPAIEEKHRLILKCGHGIRPLYCRSPACLDWRGYEGPPWQRLRRQDGPRTAFGGSSKTLRRNNPAGRRWMHLEDEMREGCQGKVACLGFTLGLAFSTTPDAAIYPRSKFGRCPSTTISERIRALKASTASRIRCPLRGGSFQGMHATRSLFSTPAKC
jgi:hypothetical protein